MELEFVKDLNESKLYRTRQQLETADMRDVIDFAFLNLLTLHILNSDYNTAPIAQAYAKRTLQSGSDFKAYRQNGNDLYQALYKIVTGTANNDKEKIQVARVKLPEAQIRQYLKQIATGQPTNTAKNLFMRLERAMDIQESNYRSLRRLASDWNNLTNSQRSLVSTRLLQFYRTRAIRSELYPPFSAYAKSGGYFIQGLENAEKKVTAKRVAAKVAAGAAAFAGGFVAGRAFGRSLVK